MMKRPLFTFPIPSDALNALHKAGYRTYQDLFNSRSEPTSEAVEILHSMGFSWKQLNDLTNPAPKSTARDILNKEKGRQTIPTFSEALDDIIGGGVPLGSVFQICGPPSSGKTQLLMQLCVDVQIPVSLGGLKGSALFIDSEKGFSKTRFTEIGEMVLQHCKRIGEMYGLTEDLKELSVNSLLSRVHYTEVSSHVELMSSIKQIDSFVTQNHQVKLIVLDSIVMPLLAITNMLDRTRFLARIISELQHIATRHSIAVVFANDMSTWISPNGEKQLVPSLGETASHLSPNILILSRHSSYFSGLVYKSSALPPHIAHFTIGKEGIGDINSC